MGLRDAIVWTPEMDAWVGTGPDAKVAVQLGLLEWNVRRRRLALEIPAYRSTLGEVKVNCANCGGELLRKQRSVRRSKRLFCDTTCAAAGQKRRDAEALRYGPGWKKVREEIRQRDKNCRACGKTPEGNGAALQVNHLVPYRFGGTNIPANLVALCESCHHRVDAVVAEVLASLPIAVSLDGSLLTISLGDSVLWRGSALGATSQIGIG